MTEEQIVNKQLKAAITTAATAANAAIALAEKTHSIAEALTTFKTASDIVTAVLSSDVKHIQIDITEIKQTLKDINSKDEQYVLKEDFAFWRNLLVSGMLLTIVVAILTKLIIK